MSRLAKKPIVIPASVTVTVAEKAVSVKGPKGEIAIALHPHVHLIQENNGLLVTVDQPDILPDRALWGTFASLLKNAIVGVQQEYEKRLELVGIGFRAQISGSTLTLNVGFSHPVTFILPDGISGAVEKNIIVLKGIKKDVLGEAASRIRAIKKPEPYQGKGIKYVDEVIRRKAGKAVKAAGSPT